MSSPPTHTELYADNVTDDASNNSTTTPVRCGGYLKLYCADPELRSRYQQRILAHNHNLETNIYADSGFDLFIPDDTSVKWHSTVKINLNVKAAMFLDPNYTRPIGYLLYPRSSITNTPLVVANHVGVIDAGYRGDIKLAVRNLNSCPTLMGSSIIKPDTSTDYDGYCHTRKFERLAQICLPSLMPIHVSLVDSEEELGMKTSRGSGAYGSTGR